MTVVKVGGSLLDWPELGPRLRGWLADHAVPAILVPGGGPTTDLVRAFDKQHNLGEKWAHWLALRALTFNAHFLSALLPSTEVVTDLAAIGAVWKADRTPVVDAWAVLVADEGRPGALDHTWAAGSDVVALRLAELVAASRLVLLKSAAVSEGSGLEDWGREGLVDGAFPARARVVSGLKVEVINFRDL